MSTRENPPQRPTAADDLLAEQALGPAELAALREVLRAAQTPAAPGELRGEAAALAAFRAARAASPAVAPDVTPAVTPAVMPGVAPDRPGRRRVATLISVKAAAALVALTGMGGVALAASTGTLPGPLDGSRSQNEKVRQVDPDDAVGPRAQDRADGAGQRQGAADAVAADQAEKKIAALRAGSDAKAVAALGRMCKAYDKGDFATKTRTEQSRAFRVLLRAAGSPGAVPEFCAMVAAAGARDAARATEKQAAAKARLGERRQADDRQGGAQQRAEDRAEDRAGQRVREQGRVNRPASEATGDTGNSEVAQGSKRERVGADPETGDRPGGNAGDH